MGGRSMRRYMRAARVEGRTRIIQLEAGTLRDDTEGLAMSDKQPVIVFALFPGVTQLDFTGPHQVFSSLPGASVILASAAGGTIESTGGMIFAGVRRLADIRACDLVCVPGGAGVTDNAIGDEVFLRELRRLAATAKFVTSVCTGSLALGAAGLLRGRR